MAIGEMIYRYSRDCYVAPVEGKGENDEPLLLVVTGEAWQRIKDQGEYTLSVMYQQSFWQERVGTCPDVLVEEEGAFWNRPNTSYDRIEDGVRKYQWEV